MFNLEKAIKKWLKTLRKNEALEDGYIAELESHLRDEIGDQIKHGTSEEDAFRRAVESIGQPEGLGEEFYKIHTRRLSGRPPWEPPRFMPELIWNYMKIALRRIKRQKGYSFINIFGLAIGIACCILSLLWVQDELSFDRFHKNTDDIYRVISEIHTTDRTTQNARTPNPLGPALKEKYPEIIDFVRFQGFDNWLVKRGDKSFTNDNLGTADPSFFEMFTFPFIKGDPKTALNERYSIVITENMARKYFGDEDPMGKILNLLQDFKVTGVIKNIPENSHLHFDCIFPIVNMELYWDENFENWRRVQFYTYIQLQKTSPVRDVNQKISHTIQEYLPKYNTQIFLQPLKDIHLRSDYEWDLDNYKKGNMALVYIFSFTALCILMIACINFMNLSTARSANRTKEVGMRKVTGALRRDIIKQFFGETLLLCFIALLVALILVEIFLPAMNSLSGKQLLLNFSGNMNLILGLIAITLFTGILSGSYPALYLSAFQPVNIFKKHFRAKQTRGISLRKLLVVLQFTLTVILIIGTTVVYKQIHYMLQRDLGFNKSHVLIFGLRHFNQETFTNELLQNPNILSITYSQAPDSQPPGISGFDWEGKNPEEELMLYPVVADYDYLKTFDMEMVQGRFFSREHTTDAASAFVVNETASNAMGLENPVGTRLSFRDFRMEFDGTIIGVMKDFHQSSLHNTIEPLVFYIPREGYHRVCVKISSNNVPETLAFIETIWKKYTTDYPINYEFLDEKINSFYKTEQTIGQIFQYFTSLAIIIACLGLFGLASFSAEQRTKEIGIRKVLGASVSGIVIMLTKEFTKWIIIATIIACPVAYLVIQKWLQTFSYRISLGLEIFIFSGALALVIALLTVSYQAIRAARANPVDSLRYE